MFKIKLYLMFLLSSLTLQSAEIVDQNPVGVIQGIDSLIRHPEGIAFSPSGDLVAIANSEGGNILFFLSSDCCISSSQVSPIYVIDGLNSPLGYPHDLSFSPDGEHLAVACRGNNRIMIYKRNIGNDFYEQEPFVVIEGNQLQLPGINAVKYSPTGNCLGVCDVAGHQIAFFLYNNDTYESLPYQVIQAPEDILYQPDGLAFSSDGRLLAVTSHGTHSLLIFEKTSSSEGKYSASPVEILKGEETNFCFTHSVCFHPLDDTLAVSSAGGRKTLSLFKKVSDTVPRYSIVPSQTFEIYNPETIHLQQYNKEEGGVKGVAFSPDGKILGLCAQDMGDPLKSILFYTIGTRESSGG